VVFMPAVSPTTSLASNDKGESIVADRFIGVMNAMIRGAC
jgi:hypothetical protein